MPKLLCASITVPLICLTIPCTSCRHVDRNNYTSIDCMHLPSKASLNVLPVQYGTSAGFNCTDFPAIDARVVNGGTFSTSTQDWADGLSAKLGDEVYVRLYIHNSARLDEDSAMTIARDVTVVTRINSTTDSDHVISVTIRGDNTNTVTSSFTIHTPPDGKLQILPASGELYDYRGHLIKSGFQIGDDTYLLGSMQPSFERSRFICFSLKIVPRSQPD